MVLLASIQIVKDIRPSLFDGSKQQLQLDPLEAKVDAVESKLDTLMNDMAEIKKALSKN